MSEQFVKDYYLKVKLLRQTDSKQIWLVKNTLDSETAVAKIQYVYENAKRTARNVLHQGKFLQVMQGHLGIPFLHWAGKQEAVSLSIIIVQRLGYTLEERLRQLGGRFSLKTVCQLGISMFKIVQGLHEKGYVVGNIKMNSFQLGMGSKAHSLYLNDLMQSTSYLKKGKHIAKQQTKQRVPVHQFMSYNRLAGFEASRRDDIQSIVLMLVYFLKGQLPWTQLFEKLHQKEQIFQEDGYDIQNASMSKQETKQDTLKFHKKLLAIEDTFAQKLKCINKFEQTSVDEICEDLGELKAMLKRCRQWEFQEKPDYNFLNRSLKRLMARHNLDQDGVFDWMKQGETLILSNQKNLQSLKFELWNQEQNLNLCYSPFCQKIEIS